MSAEGDFATPANILIAGAAATTAWSARKALNTWRDQMQGEANFTVAKDLARAAYNLRDELYACQRRSVRVSDYPPEYRQAPRVQWSGADKHIIYSHVFENRLNTVADTASNFELVALEAEALWGPVIRESTTPLLRRANNGYRRLRGGAYQRGRLFGDN